MTTKKPVIHISDPARAALCLTLGARLVDCQGRRGRRLSYIFDDVDNTATIACGAYVENRPVPIQSYLENLRRCRELLWQYRLTIESENDPYHRAEAEAKTEAPNADAR
jgi:hypothetical protein